MGRCLLVRREECHPGEPIGKGSADPGLIVEREFARDQRKALGHKTGIIGSRIGLVIENPVRERDPVIIGCAELHTIDSFGVLLIDLPADVRADHGPDNPCGILEADPRAGKVLGEARRGLLLLDDQGFAGITEVGGGQIGGEDPKGLVLEPGVKDELTGLQAAGVERNEVPLIIAIHCAGRLGDH